MIWEVYKKCGAPPILACQTSRVTSYSTASDLRTNSIWDNSCSLQVAKMLLRSEMGMACRQSLTQPPSGAKYSPVSLCRKSLFISATLFPWLIEEQETP